MAIGQDDGSGCLSLVSNERPLPTVALAPAAPAPLEGSASAPMLAGPFTPAPLAPIYLTLSGAWQGSVQLMRSTADGTPAHRDAV
ncbi:MAG: hypothetical protein R3E14_05195 [Erythrobacter sp.]